jgi:uncharacterized integral membrane protein (TIGR00697 family)
MAEQHSTPSRQATPLTRSLFLISIIYGGMVCVAGVLGNKQVSIGPLAVEAGIFAFLLLVIMSSAVAELHGEKTAQQLVRFGFAPLLLSMVLALIVWALPASPKMLPENRDAIQLVLFSNLRIWLAGIIAYGTSQTLNVMIFARLRGDGAGRQVWLRGAIAAVLSQIVDTLLFVTIAFYGEFPITDLLLGQMLAKVVLSALLVPLLVSACVAWGRRIDA